MNTTAALLGIESLGAEVLIAFFALALMEIVLGIDNLVFISILVEKLPSPQQAKGRTWGLVLALGTRLALLFTISWMSRLTAPLFAALGRDFSGRDLILLAGGLFLIAKSTHEIYDKLEAAHEGKPPILGRRAFWLVVGQIALLDIVFSFDSVITAIGMTQKLGVMVAAIVAAILVMIAFAGWIGKFLRQHPSLKILALSFLLLIGVMLFLDGLGKHVEKGYIYFAMAFSLIVELLNMRYRRRLRPVELHTKWQG